MGADWPMTYLQYGRIIEKVVLFIGLFERGDDDNKLTAEKMWFKWAPNHLAKPL